MVSSLNGQNGGCIYPTRAHAAHNSNCQQQILMVSGSKRRTPASHLFQLSGHSSRFLRQPVEVSFQPLPKSKSARLRSILPTFNRDCKHYTPAFCIPAVYGESDEQLRGEHERRVVQAEGEIEDMMYPKPRSKQRYCGVCKDYYEDYKEHVEGEGHMDALTRSTYQRLIKEEAGRFMGEQFGQRRLEDEKTQESVSEDQLFKCLSLDGMTEGCVGVGEKEEWHLLGQ